MLEAPLPPTVRVRYEGILQSVSPEGYPRLGSPDAPGQLRLYAAFDSLGSRSFFNNVFVPLLERVRSGQIAFTYVPLYEGNLQNVGAATRAALCAGEQGAFWALHDTLYSWNEAFGMTAFLPERVDAGITALGLDRATYEACMASQRPDEVLAAARGEVFIVPGFTSPPAVVVNGQAVPPDFTSVTQALAGQPVAALPTTAPAAALPATAMPAATTDSAPAGTPPPAGTAAPAVSSATTAPQVTPESTPGEISVQIIEGVQIQPPITLTLPQGWLPTYTTIVIPDLDGVNRPIPVAVYRGPVTGGTGFIVLLWGFPSIVPGNPFEPEGITAPNMHAEGLRLFRQALVDPDCQRVGTDVQRDYMVGGLPAQGTEITILECSMTVDTRGWFAGLRVDGMNFVFYVYTEPLQAMDTARGELQAVLDTVQFTVEEVFGG